MRQQFTHLWPFFGHVTLLFSQIFYFFLQQSKFLTKQLWLSLFYTLYKIIKQTMEIFYIVYHKIQNMLHVFRYTWHCMQWQNITASLQSLSTLDQWYLLNLGLLILILRDTGNFFPPVDTKTVPPLGVTPLSSKIFLKYVHHFFLWV